MNISKSVTLNWKQIGLFKLSILTLGIAVGAYWPEIFSAYLVPLLVVAIVSGAYVTFIWWKQRSGE